MASNSELKDCHLTAFSETLLAIYDIARHSSLEDFQRNVLEEIELHLPHSSAWWGRASIHNDGPHLHSTHLKNLTDTYLSEWKAMRENDITVERVFDAPGKAIIIDFSDDETPAELKQLGENHHIDQLLCVIAIDPVTQLCDHLALYRQRHEPDFTQQDIALLSSLMPHLVSAMATNQLRTLYNLRESINPQRVAFAICDNKGILQMSEPSFTQLILQEIPDWKGPQLPLEWCQSEFSGQHISISLDRIGGLLLLQARLRDQADHLSSREMSVAKLMNEGMTYKMIARELDIAPNTVRHHIRSMYQKLNVHNKAELVRLMQSSLH
ncbi:putative Transcriptional regulator, LuxR family [Vibrio nigripulchritudo SFn27]|uniref:Putative Transcriptional regulator, LuxR family n=1 Tax=Vibrio nigripulchritudo TaxID=28173 RepID=U4K1V7_9VIBR|nr:helix-turn-helix transcriptional regulator [Vibrio nigripulchritudo]CCN83218.1 putative Transcriptional regulator, LuxR family [Vibrio nigripulchritudo BLFn1]CCN88599.1 putative Transcriptional regulator, LuxR family [Vibrio nigripulchritudo SFn27]CCN92738.1 putative Transcriptional regulator, LuxR family [Vibrio nigripulchritudo ENn2]CCO40324.1 putative Transcriptional regulator, LuxR family [Vibrio nigripulchritudo SFn135]CCO52692.1 putative Transcriptional regulator, LuxR family [Vibrio 